MKFDYVVCNPPYVSEKEYEDLQEEIYFEPKLALVAGGSGLEAYEKIERDLPLALNPGGKAFFEIGKDQGQSIMEIFSKTGSSSISEHATDSSKSQKKKTSSWVSLTHSPGMATLRTF